MAERGMPDVMGKGDGFGKIDVQPERECDGARYLGYFQGMGQPGTVIVALMVYEYLSRSR
jgi:hypothetical protein